MTDRAPLRLVIADDSEEVRLLLRAAIGREADMEIVGEASDGREAVDAVAERAPDVLLLDVEMPVLDGLSAIPQVRRAAPDTRIVVLSGFERQGMRAEAQRLGADACLTKGVPLEEIVDTVRAVCGRMPGRRDGTAPAAPAPDASATDGSVPGDAGLPPPDQPGDASPDVLSTLGHELASPVAVVAGFAALLERDAASLTPEEIAEYARAMSRGANQLEQLIRAFYDARRLASGTFGIERAPTDVGALVGEVVQDLSATLSPRVVRFHDPPDVVVPADPVRIRQVVSELITNAAKFSPTHEPIDVKLTNAAGAVEVAVLDRCAGIAPEHRVQLFRRFGKLRRGGPGLGLGLHIARGIARAHGGDLVYDPRPGGGCRFTLRLPAQ